MTSNKPLSRQTEIITQETDGEIMVYDLSINKAFCLSKTSSLVWQMCDGNNSVGEISEALAEKLNSTANEDLVWLAIDQLKKENLIANSEELENKFEGLSRRDVIKKIGLGTMIALPVVSGLVAPKAINAASTGQFVGNATISGTGSTSCGGGAANIAARDSACNSTYGPAGSNACPNGAVRQPGNCNYVTPPTDTSTFGCLCS